MTASSLSALLMPDSIAVIGASREPSKWGFKVFHNIVSNGYKGLVYPVNPSPGEIDGYRSYPDIGSVPGDVDLAIIIVPSQAVLNVVDECGAKGVKALCVITAGFSEVGPEGAALEEQLKEKADGLWHEDAGPEHHGLRE